MDDDANEFLLDVQILCNAVQETPPMIAKGHQHATPSDANGALLAMELGARRGRGFGGATSTLSVCGKGGKARSQTRTATCVELPRRQRWSEIAFGLLSTEVLP